MSEVPNPELYLKPGAHVRLTDDGVEKRMNPNEVEAYRILAEYGDSLQDDTVSVTVPQLVEYDETTQTALLTRVGNFTSYSCPEYFGESSVYTPSYYTAIHGVARVLRKAIPPQIVNDNQDYEAVATGRVSSIDYLVSGLSGRETGKVTGLVEMADWAAERTQPYIEELPQQASHRDPNPNNFSVAEADGKYHVAVVDWETFGLSRTGYDEGRLMAYLALDPSKRAAYADHMQTRLTPQEQLYFWRVAINRSVREVISLTNGHYDSRLAASIGDPADVVNKRLEIIDGLVSIVFRGLHGLNRLGV